MGKVNQTVGSIVQPTNVPPRASPDYRPADIEHIRLRIHRLVREYESEHGERIVDVILRRDVRGDVEAVEFGGDPSAELSKGAPLGWRNG